MPPLQLVRDLPLCVPGCDAQSWVSSCHIPTAVGAPRAAPRLCLLADVGEFLLELQ